MGDPEGEGKSPAGDEAPGLDAVPAEPLVDELLLAGLLGELLDDGLLDGELLDDGLLGELLPELELDGLLGGGAGVEGVVGVLAEGQPVSRLVTSAMTPRPARRWQRWGDLRGCLAVMVASQSLWVASHWWRRTIPDLRYPPVRH